MTSIALGELIVIAGVMAIVGSLLYWMFRPENKRPLTRDEFQIDIDRLVVMARWFVLAAEHRKKIGQMQPEDRRKWVLERLKLQLPMVPDALWNIAMDAVLGEIDEAKATVRVAAEAEQSELFELVDTSYPAHRVGRAPGN